jgi:hypothetical protein
MIRKMLPFAAAVAFALPLATTAHAQVSFGVAAGASAPVGDLGDGLDMGYHVMGSVSFSPPLAPVGLRVDGMFNQFAISSDIADGHTRILAATANAVFATPGILGPYLIGGIGMYNLTSKVGDVSSDGVTKFGINAGAGFRFGLSGFSAFAEARYHYVDSGNASFIPISFGVTF